MKGAYRVYMHKKLVKIITFCLVMGMIFGTGTNSEMLANSKLDEGVTIEKQDVEPKVYLNEKMGTPLTFYEANVVEECAVTECASVKFL